MTNYHRYISVLGTIIFLFHIFLSFGTIAYNPPSPNDNSEQNYSDNRDEGIDYNDDYTEEKAIEDESLILVQKLKEFMIQDRVAYFAIFLIVLGAVLKFFNNRVLR